MIGIDCIRALKALGEETRLRMLRVLFDETLSVTEISTQMKISPYNASKHLRVMRDAELVETKKQGKLRLYTVSSKLKTHLKANGNIIDLGCCTFRLNKLPK